METPAESLKLEGSSSNTNLVPKANIVFGGSGSERTLTVIPADSQAGTTAITVTVTDSDGGATRETFTLTVTATQPLQFVAGSMLSNGTFRVLLSGSPLQNAVIQVSPDFSAWLPVFTNSDQTNLIEWTDTGLSNGAFRFYRAVR
jgi:hypothetical protein